MCVNVWFVACTCVIVHDYVLFVRGACIVYLAWNLWYIDTHQYAKCVGVCVCLWVCVGVYNVYTVHAVCARKCIYMQSAEIAFLKLGVAKAVI